MPTDAFASAADSPMAPARECFAIVPDDLGELPQVTKAIYIGQGGNLTLIPVDGDAPVTFANVVAGSILDIRVRAVMQAGTTAADIVGLA